VTAAPNWTPSRGEVETVALESFATAPAISHNARPDSQTKPSEISRAMWAGWIIGCGDGAMGTDASDEVVVAQPTGRAAATPAPGLRSAPAESTRSS
jgi:hypothetical protein